MEKRFILTCDCGCGNGIEFMAFYTDPVRDDDMIYASFFQSIFYAEQPVPFKKIRNLIRNIQTNCSFDIIVSKEKLMEFRDFLQSVKCGNKETQNELSLTIDTDYFTGESDPVYGVSLAGKPKLKTLLTGQEYKNYEYEINEAMRLSLIDAIDEATDRRPANKDE